MPRAGHVPIQRLNRTEYAAAVKDLARRRDRPGRVPAGRDRGRRLRQHRGGAQRRRRRSSSSTSASRATSRISPSASRSRKSRACTFPPADRRPGRLRRRHAARHARRRALHAQFPGRRRIPHHDHGPRRRPVSRARSRREHTLVMLLDRNEVFRATARRRARISRSSIAAARRRAPRSCSGSRRFRVQVTAGVHEIAITFIERARAATEEHIFGFQPYGGFSYTGKMRVPRRHRRHRGRRAVRHDGPLAHGEPRQDLRLHAGVAQPTSARAPSASRRTLATRAFRRPVDAGDLERLMPFYENGRAAGRLRRGHRAARDGRAREPGLPLSRDRAVASDDRGETFALDDFELASRLSFFLWSQGPDDELLKLAAAGELARPRRHRSAGRAHARRSARRRRSSTSFALRWLNVDDLDAVEPDKRLFPEFTDALRDDFADGDRAVPRERAARGPRRARAADGRLHVRQRAARAPLRHRGVVHGPQFRRVTLDGRRAPRAARQGRGAAAHVVRRPHVAGAARRLGARQAHGHAADAAAAGRRNELSTRPRARSRRRSARGSSSIARTPNCNACHGVIDPYGLALENFTATGQWRDVDRDADEPIDASDGAARAAQPVNGPVELRQALLRATRPVRAGAHARSS